MKDEVPKELALRFALRLCTHDAVPPLSGEEFESLYGLILDNESTGWEKIDAGKIIDNFLKERK